MLKMLLSFWRYCFSPQATEHQHDDESDSSEEGDLPASVQELSQNSTTCPDYELIKDKPGYISFDSLGGKTDLTTEY